MVQVESPAYAPIHKQNALRITKVNKAKKKIYVCFRFHPQKNRVGRSNLIFIFSQNFIRNTSAIRLNFRPFGHPVLHMCVCKQLSGINFGVKFMKCKNCKPVYRFGTTNYQKYFVSGTTRTKISQGAVSLF